MGNEADDELLKKLAEGLIPHAEIFPTPDTWPRLLDAIVTRLNKIAHEEFPIPTLPPPAPKWNRRAEQPSSNTPVPSSPTMHPTLSPDADKENADPAPPAQPAQAAEQPAAAAAATSPPKKTAANPDGDGDDAAATATALPPQLSEMLSDITTTLSSFPSHPPHTIQRVAELVLEPTRHYRALASYLHALDRVVRVTSSTSAYPLPLPDVSFANGAPADTVSWASTAQNNPGSDEALGGALLTPVPWLPSESSPHQRELRTESTETIEGPNGVGSIETVSISVNGMAFARGAAQAEILRREQASHVSSGSESAEKEGGEEGEGGGEEEEEEEEEPHARGPVELGANDLGPTVLTINRIDENSLHPQEIDLEAAVGRKMDSGESPGRVGEGAEAAEVEAGGDVTMEGGEGVPKRGAEEGPEGELSPKKARSEADEDMGGVGES
ncbi:uncharacterized protein DNG_05033 [Cephalotrichum gorgonifer]|uniref:PPP4R2 domain-containing protein n=1 Tax=Cephalotrichum gorgonifer TaxID=2041049 RepID=A0AAE8MXR3_9PEZI|nr:uncharacterized protein DNG_05033 [Cephalotrichum gorgonifer]